MNKKFITVMLPLCLLFGQSDQPELPGWGVYIGGGMVSAGGDSVDFEGVTVKSLTAFPNIGITKGVSLGGFPMIVGIGMHKRGYSMEIDFFGEAFTSDVNMNYLDIWASVPYPVGPVTLNAGFLVGSFLSGTMTILEIDVDMVEGPDALDYGLLLGVGYPLPIMDNALGLHVGYYLGLADNDGVKFNGLYMNMGYNF